ncbi:MAG: aldehyde ferredoxin oxidoreductase family protein [Deltaproteobacteria bacterium]|nr:aldehyde ferredoxin oxidoreductase family protein [Deltaproteobacteria bacterium]
MPNGYAGKLLFVDLTKGTIKEEVLEEGICRDFVGGTGLGVRILYERMPSKADPLGEDNMLGFVTGPLTATGVAGGGRFTVVTKSPVTGGWADSNSGGFWGPELKWAGYDAVFITGISPDPVYLFIAEGKASLRDASHLWGKDANETDDMLQKELGEPQCRIACIGPSGESCSLMAGIVNEKGRIAARSGVGAVMGSKRLKAVAVRGNKNNKIPVADPETLKSAQKAFVQSVQESPFHGGLTAAGTGGGTSFLLSIGDCPTKNWTTTGTESMPTCEKLDGSNMDPYKLKGYGCHACTIRCGALVQVKEGPFATQDEVHRPEYETLAALGALCLNDQLESVIKANEICNLYGLDTIAVGGAVAFAMECYEKGLIDKSDTDGIELKWGSGEAVVALTDKIAKREGIGGTLADGVKKAAEIIGKGAEDFAMHIGGHRLPYHDPRMSPSLGAYYIGDSQPACHMGPQGTGLLEKGVPLGSDPSLAAPKSEFFGDYDKKGDMYATGSAYYQLLSSAGLCALYAIGFPVPVVELMAPVTGWDLGWEEGIRIGKRILTLRQAFNAREGVRPDQFKMPKRLLEPLTVGPGTGQKVDFETLRKSYFETLGWDAKTGMPGKQALADLGLEKSAPAF